MGAGASSKRSDYVSNKAAPAGVDPPHQKKQLEKQMSVWSSEREGLVCHVKSDIDEGANFISGIKKYLDTHPGEIKDTKELRTMLADGCKRVSTLLGHFRSEEVFTLLERVSDQEKMQMHVGKGKDDAQKWHKEHGIDMHAVIGILHAYSDELPHAQHDNDFHVSPTKRSRRKILRQTSFIDARVSARFPSVPCAVSIGARKDQREALVKIEGRVKTADWDIDIFEVDKFSGGKAMQFLGTRIFQFYDFHHAFNIEQTTLEMFLSTIHGGYLASNPYHNANHGADVMYTVYCFFFHSSRLRNELTMIDKLSAVVAAAIHDYKHNGRNNTFHKTHSSDLAIQFNDMSPLENMHVSEGFKTLQKPSCNIFKAVLKADYLVLRRNIIRMVLGTDMANHFNHVADFRTKLKAEAHSGTPSMGAEMAMIMTLHAADISNAAKATHIYQKWANLVMAEFIQQGDEEKQLGVTPVQMFDREKVDMAKSQHGFIDFIILPTFEVWGAYVIELKDTFQKNVEANRKLLWEGWTPPPPKHSLPQ